MVENEQEEDIGIPIYSNGWRDKDMHLKAVTVTANIIANVFATALHIFIDGNEITIRKNLAIEDINNLFANIKSYEEFKEAICSLINDY